MIETENVINKFVKESQEILKDNLTGIYLHGSAVMGCFNPEKSDLDLIVVVNEPLQDDVKRKFMNMVIEVNEAGPAKGIEMSIVTKDVCKPFVYPTPFELHFSEMHLGWYKDDPQDYVRKMKGTDKDLAAHFTIIGKRGKLRLGDRHMSITLKTVERDDVEILWKMQIEGFSGLLEKYHDYDLSPAAEGMDKVMARFEQPWTTYFFIMADDEKVGAIRIVDKKDGSRKRISPIWIMSEHRNKGYAQQAILEAEKIYGPDNWCLDTILQEKGNLHLYEKLGYHQTGKIDKISDCMDIVFYEKD